ncbi:hypothetical protein [Nocardia otitidiscaviarum]|uniref:hypothetical protein n=1 Tax=Nocardia otitidiscaviarum TaxID=1823 RepID=UPI0004A71A34|nr:hypothetical protein [Nocardia otitidiscaviarum]
MADKYIRLDTADGTLKETEAIDTSAGAGDAGKIPALDSSGRFDPSMMPVGIGADTQSIEASENLAAGDFVNVWNDAGTTKVRKADATTAGKHAHGFVLAAVTSGNQATVYFEGTNTQVSGQTGGDVFLSTTPGVATGTPPSSAGNVVQRLGAATSATTINVETGQPVVLA